jgi:hypothetical protein
MPKLKLTIRQSADLIAHDAEIAKVKADPAKALANLKRRYREQAKRMLDPKYGTEANLFPSFTPGSTTTAEYIRTAQALQPLYLSKWTFVHRDGIAPWEAA